MNFSLLFCILLLIYALGISIERRLIFGFGMSPITWFSFLWLIATLLLAMQIHEFHLNFTSDLFAYVILIHLLFTFACLFGTIVANRSVNEKKEFSMMAAPHWLLSAMLLLGLLGVIIFFLDIHLAGRFSVIERFSVNNLANIKLDYADSQRSATFGAIINFIGKYSYGIGQIGIMFFAFRNSQGINVRNFDRYLAFALMSTLVLSSFFVTGGRIELIMLILMYLLSSGFSFGPMVRKRRRRFGAVSVLFLLVLTVLYVSFLLLEDRIGGDAFSSQLLFEVSNASNSNWFESAFGSVPGFGTISLQLSYLTSPIPYLGVFLSFYSMGSPDLYYGLLSFAPIIQPINYVFGFFDSTLFQSAALARTAVLSDQGYFGNVWGTLGRELLVDFGYFGSLLFFAILGFFSGVLRIQAFHFKNEAIIVMYTLVRIQLLFSIGHGLFGHRTFGYAFAVAMLLVIIQLSAKLFRRS